MKQLNCPSCHTRNFFERSECTQCAAALSFDAGQSRIVAAATVVPCANLTLIGCNWSTSTDDGYPYCRSCRLTRTIPNLVSDRNLMLWRRVEQAKRRLTYDMMRLGLPLAVPSGASSCRCRSTRGRATLGRSLSGARLRRPADLVGGGGLQHERAQPPHEHQRRLSVSPDPSVRGKLHFVHLAMLKARTEA